MQPPFLRKMPLFLGISLFLSQMGNAGIRITLFGQPCLLQGPLDDRTLRVIHSLSPDQLSPPVDGGPLAAAPTRGALEKLRAISGAPAGLDRYRERMAKRLEAQLALLVAVESARADGKAAPLLAAAKTYLPAKKLKDFGAALKKAEATRSFGKSETVDSLFDTFSDGIEADSEEEFHRSIHRMGIQYACSFDNMGEESPTGAAKAAKSN